MAPLNIYNLASLGVDVDTDNIHVPSGSWRKAQNLNRSPISETGESVVTRFGLAKLNGTALAGAVLGGIPIPAFEVGDGDPSLFIGFGD